MIGSVQAESVLRWAADTNSNAPYTFYNGQNKLTGFEYEIINAVARQMGRRAQFVQNDWDGLIPGLGRGLYDCVICGVEITPDRAQEVLFSQPYYVTFNQFVSRKGATPIRSLKQLSGKQIGTLDQTSALRLLEETGGVTAKIYDQEINAYQDVANGRIAGVLLDYPIAKYYAEPNPELQLNGPPFGEISYGIAISKGNPELCKEINAALSTVITSGELRHILSGWDLWTEADSTAFDQPVTASAPKSDYKAFVNSYAARATLWTRLKQFAGFWPLLLSATILTLEVSILGMSLAIVAGFAMAVARVFGPKPLKSLAIIYIEVVRGTPLLVQLFIIFYGLPNIGISLSPFVAGVLGLGLNYAAYEAENYRAGLLAVHQGQMEAARALGMTRQQGLIHVVMPQAFRFVLPPVTNDFISLLKDSSLVSMVTLLDLTGAYNRIATQTFDYFGTGIFVALLYFLIGLPFVRLARFTEERLAIDQRRSNQRPGLFRPPKPKQVVSG
ncbi:MAG: ABC transporter permease subunit [Verrucomicrobia bacterium]|nr:ABC transporter permease subunit [Verrucomicrobiota bacterium]